jgi:ketose-bisphosphate aldolase
MALIGMKEILTSARAGGYGVGGFDGFDSLSIMAALEESKARKSPVILICAQAEYQALGARGVAEVARALSDVTATDLCLHLDHGGSFDTVLEAIDGGFSSVMIDGSSLPFEENVALTRKVVEYAHGKDIMVEAELGAVGRVDNTTHEGGQGNSFTNPDQAAEFVARTGCDFLAVSIGNAHGLYTTAPKFNFEVLGRIRDAVAIPLVLHGGSGTPEDQLKMAVSMGMAKVNVASEIGRAFTARYIESVVNNKTWWATAKNEAKASMREVVGKWIEMLGSSGMA